MSKKTQRSPLDHIDDLRAEAVKLSDEGDMQRMLDLEADWNLFKQQVRLLGRDFVDPDEPLPTKLRLGYRELIQAHEAAAAT